MKLYNLQQPDKWNKGTYDFLGLVRILFLLCTYCNVLMNGCCTLSLWRRNLERADVCCPFDSNNYNLKSPLWRILANFLIINFLMFSFFFKWIRLEGPKCYVFVATYRPLVCWWRTTGDVSPEQWFKENTKLPFAVILIINEKEQELNIKPLRIFCSHLLMDQNAILVLFNTNILN